MPPSVRQAGRCGTRAGTRAGFTAIVIACGPVLAGVALAQDPAGRTGPPTEPRAQDDARRKNGDAQDTTLVKAIHAEGQRRYTEQQLIDALGQEIGKPFDGDKASRGLDTLWKVFKVNADLQFKTVAGGMELRLVVTEMPVDLEPRFAGNSQVKTDTLKKWALLEDKGELFLYQAPRVRQRLLEGYHREGYFFAEVDVITHGESAEPGQAPERPDVIFEIREGPEVHVRDVVVEGNHSMPETGLWFWRDGLKKLAKLELEGPWLFNWKGAKFVEDTLQADLLAMRNVYRDRGWLDAVVELDGLDGLEFNADRSRVTLHVIVDEGERYRVSKLAIQAVEHSPDPAHRGEGIDTPAELLFPEKDLLELCRLRAGKLYAPHLQQSDMLALRAFYGERGYLWHPSLYLHGSWEFLEPVLGRDSVKHEVEVTYRIAQGRQRTIREVRFEGGEHTRDRVLRREVDVLPGELADIKEITRSLNRIYSTNYFSDESDPLEHRDPTFGFLTVDGHPGEVDIEYKVQEGQVINFGVQGGVDSNNGLFGKITLSDRNFDIADPPSSLWRMFSEIYDKQAFHGAGQTLELELSPGTLVNSWRIRFVEPDLFRTHFERYILDLDLSRYDRTYRFYDESRVNRRIRIGRQFGRELTVYGGYTNQDLLIDNIESPLTAINQPDEPPLAPSLFDEEGRSNLIGASFDVQYRKVDTGLNPKEGFTGNWRNAIYGGALGGDWDFVRSELDVDGFWQVGPPQEDVRPGFHLGLGLGVADGYGETRDVPYSERFFLGGARELRGFAYRGVGPNLGGEPLGGETSLNGTIEYRIPIYSVVQPGTYKNIEVFRMSLFADAGILDPQPYRLDLDELRASVGVGFGLTYPIPLIFSFGFPVKSGDGDRKQVFSFSIFNIWF